MIFLTVGSQMPFDRLVVAVDKWAGEHQGFEVQAQVGQSHYQAKHISTCPSLTPTEFKARVQAASVVVAHAGMGSVITALEFNKPLVLFPRRGDLRETRNDHQVATARWLADRPGIQVAMTEPEIGPALSRALERSVSAVPLQHSAGSDLLVGFLAGYLEEVAQTTNRR